MKIRFSFSVILTFGFFLSGCDNVVPKVEIKFTDAVPGNFAAGHASTCSLTGTVNNHTKYLVEGISFNVGKLNAQLEPIHATEGGERSLIVIENLASDDMDKPSKSCAEKARYLMQNMASASVLGCKVEGMAEGDCQKLVHISSVITDQTIQRIADVEESRRVAAFMPLTNALKAVADQKDDNQILDAIVGLDSKGWLMNKYDSGSMKDAVVIDQASDGSHRTVKASYTFNGGRAGWVAVRLYRSADMLPRLEYWDREGSSRLVNLPDTNG